MAEGVVDLGYSEALRVIGAQAGVLDNLRGRAGTLLAAASLVTSFLGGTALVRPSLATTGQVTQAPIEFWGWIAIAAFCLIGVVALLVMWPYVWRFDMDPTRFVVDAEDAGIGASELKRDLTTYHWANHGRNAVKLDWLFWAFRVGCIALVLETVSWLIELRQ